MITQARLALRLQRFEVIAAFVATGVVGLSALIVSWRLGAIAVPSTCWDQWFGSFGTVSDECNVLVEAFLGINEEEAGKVMAAMAVLPLFVGLFLGLPIVAREIEARTAPTVWALAASRTRWLIGRLVPMVLILVATLGFLAISSDVLWQSREPWNPLLRFGDAGLHGPGVVARGLATFGLALLAGAVTGRVLPAVIVGVALCFVLMAGWGLAFSAFGEAASELRPVPISGNADDAFPGGTRISEGWLLPDGRFLYDHEAVTLAPAGVDPYEWLFGPATETGFQRVMQGLPGSAYPTWMAIETGGFAAIGLVALLLAFPIVERRRPT